ncbi:MAG: hypothetical protein LBC19_05580, partial [Tannerella sp.]|nr:hypothetical protein [Tannerella sp.]
SLSCQGRRRIHYILFTSHRLLYQTCLPCFTSHRFVQIVAAAALKLRHLNYPRAVVEAVRKLVAHSLQLLT